MISTLSKPWGYCGAGSSSLKIISIAYPSFPKWDENPELTILTRKPCPLRDRAGSQQPIKLHHMLEVPINQDLSVMSKAFVVRRIPAGKSPTGRGRLLCAIYRWPCKWVTDSCYVIMWWSSRSVSLPGNVMDKVFHS